MPAVAQAGHATSTAPAGLRVLMVLSTLLAFASISTDLYLPALPTMAEALRTDAGTVALTIAGYLVGFSAGQLLWVRSATATAGVGRWRSGWCCSSSARPVARSRRPPGR
jgi:MFS family permease